MASTSTTCPSCCKKYASFGGEDARKPVVLTCLCRFCKECALQEEAKAQQQKPPAASGGGGKKGKKKKKKGGEEKEEYRPTPCMSCSKPCAVPVSKLPLDAVLMKGIDGKGGSKEDKKVPLCAFCAEEQATKFCGDCAPAIQFSCDGCYTFNHKSSKKKGHTSIPIQEHLSSASPAVGGGAVAGMTKMCSVHIGHPLLLFCETCNMLICGMCGSLDHKPHTLTPVHDAIAAHRALVEAAVAAVKITREEVIAATNAIKIIRGELEGNRDAAIKLIDAGFNRLLRAIKQRRDALKKMVNDAYTEKDDVLNNQITKLEGIDTHSEIALKLVEAALAEATPTELLERKQLFVDGMAQFKEHGVSLKEECGSTISAMVDVSFEQQAADILAVGWISREDTDPSASTAAGEGRTAAQVGNAAEFDVTAVDRWTGKQRSGGGDQLVVSLILQDTADEGASGGSGDGGGGAAAAAAKSESGKRKRGGDGSTGKGRAAKKSKTGASTAVPATAPIGATVVDNGDGTYSCSYTPTEGANEVGGGKWQLEVLLNGKHILGSPFAVEVRPSANMANWAFGSVVTGAYALSEGGAVATKIEDQTYKGAIVDGAGCTPMTSGIHYWELEVVKNDTHHRWPGYWFFGVCRPGIDLNTGKNFYNRADTWVMEQANTPVWDLYCTTCAGTGMTLRPKPKMPDGSRIGLLLDLDNGGTLTMYWEGKPCGKIAAGLVGPLLPCMASFFKGKVVKIHGGLAPPMSP
eukprot:gene16350-biopygen14296